MTSSLTQHGDPEKISPIYFEKKLALKPRQ